MSSVFILSCCSVYHLQDDVSKMYAEAEENKIHYNFSFI